MAGNTSWAFANRLSAIILALVLSTVLFRILGAGAYGIWAFCYVFIGYQALFDLGLGTTVERLVAQAHWAGDRVRVGRAVSQAVTCALVTGALLQVIALWLPLPAVADVDLRPLRFAVPGALLLSLLASISGAGLSGIQRVGWLSAIRTTMNALSTAIVLLLVAAGVREIHWLLLGYAVGLAGASVLAWIALQQEVGALRLAPGLLDPRLLREFARFGTAVQVGSFGPQLADQLFRLVIGARFGPAWMGYYDLGSRAAVVFRSVAGTLLMPMVPFGVQQQLSGGFPALTTLFQRTLKYTALWLLPSTALALYHSQLLIELWLGGGRGSSQVLFVFRVFLVVNALAGLAAPAAMIGRAAGVPGVEARVVLWTSGIALLAGALVPGVRSTLVAFGATTLVGAYWIWAKLRRRAIGESTALGDLAGVSGVTFVVLGFSMSMTPWLLPVGQGAARYAVAVILCAIPMLLAVPIAWTTGLVTKAERRFWADVASGFQVRRAGARADGRQADRQ